MTPGEAFQTLGIRPGSSRARGHAAYRELVKLWHPDRYSPGSPLGELAEQNTLRANLAWKVVQPWLAADAAPQPAASPAPGRPREIAPPPGETFPWSAALAAMARLIRACRSHFPGKPVGRVLRWLVQENFPNHRPWWRYPVPTANAPGRQQRLRRFHQVLAETLGATRTGGRSSDPGRPNRPGRSTPGTRMGSPRPSTGTRARGPVTPVAAPSAADRIEPIAGSQGDD